MVGRRQHLLLLRHQHARQHARLQPAALEQDIAKRDDLAAPPPLVLLPQCLLDLFGREQALRDQASAELAGWMGRSAGAATGVATGARGRQLLLEAQLF